MNALTHAQPRSGVDQYRPCHQFIPKRLAPRVPRQSLALIAFMKAAVEILGPCTRGIYLVIGEDDDAATIRKLLKRASRLTAELADRLAAAVASEQALARLRTR